MTYSVRLTLLLAYYAALNVGYWVYFKPASVEQYFEVNWLTDPIEPWAVVLAPILAVGLSALAALARKRTTDLFGVVLLLTPVMPMLVIYSDRQNYTTYMVFCALMYVLIFSMIRFRSSEPQSLVRVDGILNPSSLSTFALIATWLFIALDIAAGNLTNLNFDFSRVYEFRRAADIQRGSALNYFETNLTTFVIGLGTVVAIHKRQWLQLLLFLAGTIMIYGLTNHRAHFFVVFIALAFYWTALRAHPFTWIVGGATGVALLSAASLQFLDYGTVGDFTIGRVMFIPAVANFMYFDYFSVAPKMSWSDSQVGLGLIANPYGTLTGPRVIFDHFGGVDLSNDALNYGNANTGFLGAGFGHAGYVGVFIYTLVVSFMVRIADALADRTNLALSFGAFGYMFLLGLFTSSDVPTMFLTNSYLIAILVVFAVRRPDKSTAAF
jgi:hypothetical protein